jgi:hypothetical protein
MTSDGSVRGTSAWELGTEVDAGWASDWPSPSSVTSGCSALGSCWTEVSTSAMIATLSAPAILRSGARVDVAFPKPTCVGGEAAGSGVLLADGNPLAHPPGITLGGLHMKSCFYKDSLC